MIVTTMGAGTQINAAKWSKRTAGGKSGGIHRYCSTMRWTKNWDIAVNYFLHPEGRIFKV